MNTKALAGFLMGAIAFTLWIPLPAASQGAPQEAAKAAPKSKEPAPQGGAARAEGATVADPLAVPKDASKAAPQGGAANAPGATTAVSFSYSSEGRRDPFKDLFGGQDIREKRVITGFADLYVDEIRIMGIVAAKGERVAIVSLPEGFPATVRAGDRFADGYVLSIDETQIVLRKTRDRGVPLQKPRDIVKEITPEELQDE